MRKNKVQTVIFYNAKRQEKIFLLLQMNESRGYHWQNVTGVVESDEDFIDAAIREAQEETGLKEENIAKITQGELFFTFTDQWKNEVFEKLFFIQVSQKWDIGLDPKEHCDYKWVVDNQIQRDSVYYQSNYQSLLEAMKIL